jgi:hypothetical protein
VEAFHAAAATGVPPPCPEEYSGWSKGLVHQARTGLFYLRMYARCVSLRLYFFI